MRSVCYAVGIKQCPSSRDAADADADVASVLPPWSGAEAASLWKEKKAEWLLETDYLYICIYIYMYICIYNVSVTTWVYIHGYVNGEKIFWTCTSRGSTSLGIMLRRQLGLERLERDS